MSILEQARQAYARMQRERNGHAGGYSFPGGGYEKNESNEKSPAPPGNPAVPADDPAGGLAKEYEKVPPTCWWTPRPA
jgi:hypothetical protein